MIASLTLVIAVGMFSESFAANEPTAKSSDSFHAKVFVRSENTKLDVFVEPNENDLLFVSLLNGEGRTLVKGRVSDNRKGIRFDISGLEDGSYQVVITNGDTKQVEKFKLKSSFQRSLTLQ